MPPTNVAPPPLKSPRNRSHSKVSALPTPSGIGVTPAAVAATDSSPGISLVTPAPPPPLQSTSSVAAPPRPFLTSPIPLSPPPPAGLISTSTNGPPQQQQGAVGSGGGGGGEPTTPRRRPSQRTRPAGRHHGSFMHSNGGGLSGRTGSIVGVGGHFRGGGGLGVEGKHHRDSNVASTVGHGGGGPGKGIMLKSLSFRRCTLLAMVALAYSGFMRPLRARRARHAQALCRQRAAFSIQCWWRRRLMRHRIERRYATNRIARHLRGKLAARVLRKHRAAMEIQRIYRGYRARIRVEKLLYEKRLAVLTKVLRHRVARLRAAKRQRMLGYDADERALFLATVKCELQRTIRQQRDAHAALMKEWAVCKAMKRDHHHRSDEGGGEAYATTSVAPAMTSPPVTQVSGPSSSSSSAVSSSSRLSRLIGGGGGGAATSKNHSHQTNDSRGEMVTSTATAVSSLAPPSPRTMAAIRSGSWDGGLLALIHFGPDGPSSSSSSHQAGSSEHHPSLLKGSSATSSSLSGVHNSASGVASLLAASSSGGGGMSSHAFEQSGASWSMMGTGNPLLASKSAGGLSAGGAAGGASNMSTRSSSAAFAASTSSIGGVSGLQQQPSQRPHPPRAPGQGFSVVLTPRNQLPKDFQQASLGPRTNSLRAQQSSQLQRTTSLSKGTGTPVSADQPASTSGAAPPPGGGGALVSSSTANSSPVVQVLTAPTSTAVTPMASALDGTQTTAPPASRPGGRDWSPTTTTTPSVVHQAADQQDAPPMPSTSPTAATTGHAQLRTRGGAASTSTTPRFKQTGGVATAATALERSSVESIPTSIGVASGLAPASSSPNPGTSPHHHLQTNGNQQQQSATASIQSAHSSSSPTGSARGSPRAAHVESSSSLPPLQPNTTAHSRAIQSGVGGGGADSIIMEDYDDDAAPLALRPYTTNHAAGTTRTAAAAAATHSRNTSPPSTSVTPSVQRHKQTTTHFPGGGGVGGGGASGGHSPATAWFASGVPIAHSPVAREQQQQLYDRHAAMFKGLFPHAGTPDTLPPPPPVPPLPAPLTEVEQAYAALIAQGERLGRKHLILAEGQYRANLAEKFLWCETVIHVAPTVPPFYRGLLLDVYPTWRLKRCVQLLKEEVESRNKLADLADLIPVKPPWTSAGRIAIVAEAVSMARPTATRVTRWTDAKSSSSSSSSAATSRPAGGSGGGSSFFGRLTDSASPNETSPYDEDAVDRDSRVAAAFGETLIDLDDDVRTSRRHRRFTLSRSLAIGANGPGNSATPFGSFTGADASVFFGGGHAGGGGGGSPSDGSSGHHHFYGIMQESRRFSRRQSNAFTSAVSPQDRAIGLGLSSETHQHHHLPQLPLGASSGSSSNQQPRRGSRVPSVFARLVGTTAGGADGGGDPGESPNTFAFASVASHHHSHHGGGGSGTGSAWSSSSNHPERTGSPSRGGSSTANSNGGSSGGGGALYERLQRATTVGGSHHHRHSFAPSPDGSFNFGPGTGARGRSGSLAHYGHGSSSSLTARHEYANAAAQSYRAAQQSTPAQSALKKAITTTLSSGDASVVTEQHQTGTASQQMKSPPSDAHDVGTGGGKSGTGGGAKKRVVLVLGM